MIPSTSRQSLQQSCRRPSTTGPDSNAASCLTNAHAGAHGYARHDRGLFGTQSSSLQDNASDEGELQSGKTGGAVEFAVEFVVIAESDVHHAREFVEIIHVDDRIHVREKRGMRIHRAH